MTLDAFLRGAGGRPRPNPAPPVDRGWNILYLRPAAPAAPPWQPAADGLASVEDARAELALPGFGLRALDLAWISRDAGSAPSESEYWVMRAPGDPVRLPPLASLLPFDYPTDRARSVRYWMERWGDCWWSAWTFGERGENLLALAVVAGVDPAVTTATAAACVRAALERRNVDRPWLAAWAEPREAVPPLGLPDATRAQFLAELARFDGYDYAEARRVYGATFGGPARPAVAGEGAMRRAVDCVARGARPGRATESPEALMWVADAETAFAQASDPWRGDARQAPGRRVEDEQADLVRARIPLIAVLEAFLDPPTPRDRP